MQNDRVCILLCSGGGKHGACFYLNLPLFIQLSCFGKQAQGVGKYTGGVKSNPSPKRKRNLEEKVEKLYSSMGKNVFSSFAIFFHLNSDAIIFTNRSCDGGAIRGLPCDIRDTIARSNNW